jgi:hypothetical protein
MEQINGITVEGYLAQNKHAPKARMQLVRMIVLAGSAFNVYRLRQTPLHGLCINFTMQVSSIAI